MADPIRMPVEDILTLVGDDIDREFFDAGDGVSHIDLVPSLEKAGFRGGGGGWNRPVSDLAAAIADAPVTHGGHRTTLGRIAKGAPDAFAKRLTADTTDMRSESPLEPAYLEKLLRG